MFDETDSNKKNKKERGHKKDKRSGEEPKDSKKSKSRGSKSRNYGPPDILCARNMQVFNNEQMMLNNSDSNHSRTVKFRDDPDNDSLLTVTTISDVYKDRLSVDLNERFFFCKSWK